MPRVLTNTKTAEMIKYASNSVLATLISFSNEIGRLCSAIGDVDVADVMRGVHEATYFNVVSESGERRKASITSFLEAGCGFGGSCLPKDITALAAQGRSLGVAMPLLTDVLEINRSQPEELLRLVRKHVPELAGTRVTVLGLAFKPDTDDLRESPAFPIIRALRSAGADGHRVRPDRAPRRPSGSCRRRSSRSGWRMRLRRPTWSCTSRAGRSSSGSASCCDAARAQSAGGRRPPQSAAGRLCSHTKAWDARGR